MSARSGPVRVKDFGEAGLRIAYREGTVDERAAAAWAERLSRPIADPFQVKSDDVILDVGAHIGGFALLAATMAPKGRVLAVEPCRESYELLARNIEMNGLTNVDTARMALSDRGGTTLLRYSEAGTWGHTITKAAGEGEWVPTETLADCLRKHGVERCDFAKFNCEGAEFPILLGAPAETLRTIRQMLIFYHADLGEDPEAPASLERHLRAAGFELERHPTSPDRGRIVALGDPAGKPRRSHA